MKAEQVEVILSRIDRQIDDAIKYREQEAAAMARYAAWQDVVDNYEHVKRLLIAVVADDAPKA